MRRMNRFCCRVCVAVREGFATNLAKSDVDLRLEFAEASGVHHAKPPDVMNYAGLNF